MAASFRFARLLFNWNDTQLLKDKVRKYRKESLVWFKENMSEKKIDEKIEGKENIFPYVVWMDQEK